MMITMEITLYVIMLVGSIMSIAHGIPTTRPTWKPTVDPTWEPTPRPTFQYAPTRYPTPSPTPRPSPRPSPFPTLHGGVHNSQQPTPSPTMSMASYAMHYELFNQEVTLADMMAIAVTIWGTIFVFALRHHYKSSGSGGGENVNHIRLEDISTHSQMSDTSQSPALQGADSKHPSLPPFTLNRNNIFSLRGSSGKQEQVVADAVASALEMPTSSAISPSAALNKDTEEEDSIRM